MDVVVVDDAEAVGEHVAALVLGSVERDPALVLGVATGATPLPVYRALARGSADFSAVRVVALDEYVGLPAGHPASYAAYVEREIAVPLGIPPDHVVVPRGSGAELERRIAELGGVDLQLLGIGRNGHLAFNEPGSPLDSRSRVVALTETTRRRQRGSLRRRAGADARADPGARHDPRGPAPRAARHRCGQGGCRRRSADRAGDAGLPRVGRAAAPAGDAWCWTRPRPQPSSGGGASTARSASASTIHSCSARTCSASSPAMSLSHTRVSMPQTLRSATASRWTRVVAEPLAEGFECLLEPAGSRDPDAVGGHAVRRRARAGAWSVAGARSPRCGRPRPPRQPRPGPGAPSGAGSGSIDARAVSGNAAASSSACDAK